MADLVVGVLAPLFALLPQQPGVPVDLVNPATVARTGTVLASLPLPRGALRGGAPGALLAVDVAAERDGKMVTVDTAPAVPLLRWPDGSIALLQAALAVPVAPRATVRVVATPRVGADGAAAPLLATAHRALLPWPLPLWTELLDPWGRVYRADLVPDPTAGPDGVLLDCGRARIVRFRSPHRVVGGDFAGRPLLDLRAYLLTFDGERRAELTLVLDGQEPSAGPLGPVRIGGFRMCTGDDALRFVPAFAGENWLPPPRRRPDGGCVQWLLVPEQDLYLGDGTAKVFRLHLFADGPDVDAGQRDAAAWAPLRTVAFADLDRVRSSRCFGACGGPAPRNNGDLGDAGRQLELWRLGTVFAPWSGFGDPEDARRSGLLRQGDSLLHNVLRWRSPALLDAAEGMVLQHGLRPSGGRAVRLPADTAPLRQGLPQRAIEAPHGWWPIDYEHCSAHLLFEYYWLTGDPWARDELARVGRSVVAMLAAVPFMTSRGEGSCLLAGTLCARATGDAALLARLVDHALQRITPSLAPPESAAALPQPAHPLVLGGDTAFDAPSQMAQLVRGLAALHLATDDARLLPLIARVADAMAGAAWLEGQGPKTFVSSEDVGRYTMAASPEDRSGADRTVIGALVLAAELAGDPATAVRLNGRADFLLDRDLPADAGLPARLQAAANPWLQIAFDRRRTP